MENHGPLLLLGMALVMGGIQFISIGLIGELLAGRTTNPRTSLSTTCASCAAAGAPTRDDPILPGQPARPAVSMPREGHPMAGAREPSAEIASPRDPPAEFLAFWCASRLPAASSPI